MNLQQNIKEAKKPFLITGPCSAESEEQVISVCREIALNQNANLLRAGIWKPRTRPDSFEGIGAIGLNWLVEAGKETNLPTSTEVANKQHVEQALKAGIDVLWIGARTTVNPFAVQEIADALQGVNIPIMVKNPINPDLELWIGAFERFEKAGITDLTAIHRGFSIYKHPKYRNVPTWEIAIGLRERIPQIPVICDPSHITGNRNLLLEVSQKALDLNFEGLMIETHPNPDKAWSDAAQQVTPSQLKDIVDNLILRNNAISESDHLALVELREKINSIDEKLFDLLASRMLLSEQVGIFKRENNITILQQEHWTKMIQTRLEKSKDLKLSQQFVRQFMDAMHQESIRHQTKIMNRK